MLRWALLSCGGCGLHGTQRQCAWLVTPGPLLEATSAPSLLPSWLVNTRRQPVLAPLLPCRLQIVLDEMREEGTTLDQDDLRFLSECQRKQDEAVAEGRCSFAF